MISLHVISLFYSIYEHLTCHHFRSQLTADFFTCSVHSKPVFKALLRLIFNREEDSVIDQNVPLILRFDLVQENLCKENL